VAGQGVHTFWGPCVFPLLDSATGRCNVSKLFTDYSAKILCPDELGYLVRYEVYFFIFGFGK
jgi:hypothetical protein